MFQLGPWAIDPSKNEIADQNQRVVKLSPLAMKLLALLCENGSDVVTIEQVMMLWKNDNGSIGGIYKLVSELRLALNENARKPKYLRTVPKQGYCLIIEATSKSSASKYSDHELSGVQTAHKSTAIPQNYPVNFVGRARETHILAQSMEHVKTSGQVLHITGDAGIGKSFLVGQAIQLAAQQSIHPVFISCHMATGKPLLWAWVRIIHQLASSPNFADVIKEVLSENPALNNLVSFRLSESTRSNSLVPHFAIWESISKILNACSTIQPLMLILDDVRELDTASFQMMEFIASDLPRSQILMILTERTGGLAQTRPDTPIEVSRLPHYQLMPLGALDSSEIETLALQLKPDLTRRDLSKLVTICDGNPLFLREFCLQHASDITQNIPPQLHTLVTNRMRLLDADTIPILQAAAVLGREFSAARLALLVEKPLVQVQGYLRTAIREVVIEPVGLRDYRFSHALLLDALLQELSVQERSSLHANAATLLDPTQDHDPIDLFELAEHMIKGADFLDKKEVIIHAMRAGHESLYQLSFEQALFFYEAVLTLCNDEDVTEQTAICDACLGIGECQMLQDGVGVATPIVQRALALSTRLNDPVRIAKSALFLSGGLPPLLDASADGIRAALKLAKAGLGKNEPALAIRLQSRLIAYDTQRDQNLLNTAEQNLTRARALKNPTATAHAAIANHTLLRSPHQFQARYELSKEILNISPEVYDLDVIVHGHVQSFYDLLQLGNFQQALLVKQAFEQLEPKQIFRNDIVRLRAACHLMNGKIPDAEHTALSIQSPERGQQFIVLLHLIMIRRYQGRIQEVLPMIEAVHADMPEIPALKAHLAMIAALSGKPQLATTQLEGLLQEEDFLPQDITRPSTLIAAVEASVATHNKTAATRLLLQVQDYGEYHIVQSSACYFGAANFFVAILKLTLGEKTHAIELLERALLQHQKIGSVPMIFRTLNLLTSLDHPDQTKVALWEQQAANLSRELGLPLEAN